MYNSDPLSGQEMLFSRPSSSQDAARTERPREFTNHENLKVFAILFAIAFSMTVATYWRVYLDANPAHPANDDASMFVEIARLMSDEVSFLEYFLTAYGDSLIPLLRAVYLTFASSTSSWPPAWNHFGYAFVVIYACSIAASGFTVWYFGRNLLVAGSVVALQVPSQVWSGGVISIFQYSGFY